MAELLNLRSFREAPTRRWPGIEANRPVRWRPRAVRTRRHRRPGSWQRSLPMPRARRRPKATGHP